MKLIVLLLTTAILQASATTYGQNVTLKKKNETLVNVFTEIRKQTGYDFFYSDKLMSDTKRISVDLKAVSLEKALEEILENQALKYEFKDKTVVITRKEPSFLDQVISGFADIWVSGVVLDAEGKPLPGASVTVKGTLKAATTTETGSFSLKDVKENSILVVSYVGYETQEIKPIANTLMQIRMIPSSGKLQEVIINAGYYTVKESERTGSISRITSKEIEKQPVTNILAALQGRMAGVNVTQITGIPGGPFTIEIRGRNSLNRNAVNSPAGNDPLYIVDGMPYYADRMDNNLLSGSIFPAVSSSQMNGINPADIESLEVLKDADATAIYGSRGANGVVLITTKKGKSGKTVFSINAYSGASKVERKIDLMNTQQYLEMRREAFKNDGYTTLPSWANDLSTWGQSRYTDWQKELIGGTAYSNNIQAQISGGSKNTTFLLSGTYNKQSTVLPGNFGYDKGSVHFDIDHKSEDQRFTVNLTGNYGIDKNNLPNKGDLTQFITLAPNAPALYKDNGELNWENSTWVNPLAALESKYFANTNTLVASSNLNYKILPGLDLSTRLGFSNSQMDGRSTTPNTINDPAYIALGYFTSLNSSYVYLSSAKQQSWNIEPQLNWQQRFGKGILKVLVGTTFQKRTNAQSVNFGQGFTSNSLIKNIAAATTQRIDNNSNTDYRYNAVFGRINYSWDEKYLINLTGRRDGSSRFGSGKQFGNFGALGAGWLFSKEKLVNQLLPALSFGKLRASYGITGSDQTDDYGFLNTYSISSSGTSYENTTGLYPTRLFNPDYSWATKKSIEIALDLGFFNDRIFFTPAYYRNRTSNQLTGIPLPGTTGFTGINANLTGATVQNKGWEFELRTVNLQSKLQWTTSFNISFNRNKLVSFPGLAGSTYARYYVIGQPLNISKRYHYTGINPTTGIYTFEDYNKDGRISNPDDGQYIADLNPKYHGGLTNSLSYKNFILDFTFEFKKQQAQNYLSAFSFPGGGGNLSVEFLDRWQQAGDTNKQFQRYTMGDNAAATTAYTRFRGSDANISDASYIRLKNLSLAYILPKSVIKVANCRIYLQAENLLTITKFRGLDPENSAGFNLPPLRVITAGLQLNF